MGLLKVSVLERCLWDVRHKWFCCNQYMHLQATAQFSLTMYSVEIVFAGSFGTVRNVECIAFDRAGCNTFNQTFVHTTGPQRGEFLVILTLLEP